MARSVTVKAGNTQILLPNGNLYDAGDTVTLSDAEWRALSAGGRALLTDNGQVADDTDAVTVQGDAVTLTAEDAAGEAPTDEEFNALRADVVALHGSLSGEGKALASA